MTPDTSKGGSGHHRGPLSRNRTRIALYGALVVVTLWFVFENTRPTKIRLWIPQVTLPLYVALLIAAVLGFLCGLYLSRRRR
ncbi:LapA family protein [Streptomyces sp. NPDC085524]|uniref:LapA family protein n=1 Tax=Streptomyces sp. NPDC085524 TaxID=3365728 RepID=UPI0037CE8AF4